MMAVDIKAESGSRPLFDRGTPKPLFETRIARAQNTSAFQYDVTADGKRFLVNTAVTAPSSPPLGVAVNWQAGLKK